MFIDAKKAHFNPRCQEDVYIQLPREAGCLEGMCGKLIFWLYGFQKAALAWEDLYAEKFAQRGFLRHAGCSIMSHRRGIYLAWSTGRILHFAVWKRTIRGHSHTGGALLLA